MESVCKRKQCTMCNACALLCPQNCIIPQKCDGSWFMAIDRSRCIQCRLCEKACPNCSMAELKTAKKVYAAWANNEAVRKVSASGGVAATLYSYAVSSGMYIAGVELNDKFEAHFQVTAERKYIEGFQNSKYTFSFTNESFKKIANLIMRGKKVLFIGLPCQIAGLKNFLKVCRINTSSLFTVDLICHGTPMPEYLQEHIHAIEERKGFKAEKVYFRDPKYGTGNFLFTIYGKQIIPLKNRKFSVKKKQALPAYKKLVISNDFFQIGYHNGWIYRDCCYQCHYAQKSRIGDLTIGDFHGLGKCEPYNNSMDEVSCLFVNTEKGEQFLGKVQNLIHIQERPLSEPYTYEPQLSHPSIGGQKHKKFVQNLQRIGDFERAAEIAFRDVALKNHIKEILHIYWIKELIKYMIPSPIKKALKKRVG